MKVIMTGGGTGGHIYPAIAIADEIKKRFPDAEILFVGAKRGLEKTLVPDNGYPIKLIPVQGFNRKNPLKNVEVLRDLKQGNKLSKQILKEFQPDVVIGTGGYASAPVVKMAQKMHIPTYIHEQNAFPGYQHCPAPIFQHLTNILMCVLILSYNRNKQIICSTFSGIMFNTCDHIIRFSHQQCAAGRFYYFFYGNWIHFSSHFCKIYFLYR